MNQRMENERQRAGTNAQNDILIRQAVIGAYQQAAQERQRLGKESEPGSLLPSTRDIVQQYLPAGVDLTQAEAIMKEATKRYFDDNNVPLSIPNELIPLTQGSYFQQQDEATRKNLMDAAYAVSQGQALAPGIDPKAKRWIEQAARALSARNRARQPQTTESP
jgi:hypothetical protein